MKKLLNLKNMKEGKIIMKKFVVFILALVIGFFMGVIVTIYAATPDDDMIMPYFHGYVCMEYEGNH